MKIIKYTVLGMLIGLIAGLALAMGTVGFSFKGFEKCFESCKCMGDCFNCIDACTFGCIGGACGFIENCADCNKCYDSCGTNCFSGCIDGCSNGCDKLSCSFNEACTGLIDGTKSDCSKFFENNEKSKKARNYLIYLTIIGTWIGAVFGITLKLSEIKKLKQEEKARKKQLQEDQKKRLEEEQKRQEEEQKRQEEEQKRQEKEQRIQEIIKALTENIMEEIEQNKQTGTNITKQTINAISKIKYDLNDTNESLTYSKILEQANSEIIEKLEEKIEEATTFDDYTFYVNVREIFDPIDLFFQFKDCDPSNISFYRLTKDTWKALSEAKPIATKSEREQSKQYLYLFQYKMDEIKNPSHKYSFFDPTIEDLKSIAEWKIEEEKRKREEEQRILEEIQRRQEEKRRKQEKKRRKQEEKQKRKIEEENRRIEVERKRRDAELKAPENICKTNIRYSTGGIGVNMNIPRPVCISCGGTGFHEYNDYYGDFKRVFCPDCNGTGYQGGYASDLSLKARCISCGGTGFRQFTNSWGEIERRSCVDCRGTGYMIDGWGT